MGSGQRSNAPVVQQAYKALDQFKYEIANELGIDQNQIYGGYWGNLTSRDCGAVGGHMVRRMIEAAEQSLAQQALAGMKTGFQTGFNAAGSNPNQSVKIGTTPNQGPNTYQ
ncbi:MAG TPA: acid-soluble spore protein [Firmicutes bacterium]|jgi:uncharacterized radical SAM superfamily protein|nr:acid-soluble spore protein [Bacillota bacterium]HAW71486.1 acid-soluble spore protein [Bacillota bacterium]HAZ21543.1 acid-soluble spore protein [Bacillota bacterium]HBE06580.1 acid-soluble spore protein [Bacillota bacterium]HBG44718.1 acid-soluble spore protein [Bacillota bacterium]